MRHFDRDFALTNRLRTEGTGPPALGRAGRGGAAVRGAEPWHRYVRRTGGPVKSEEDPLDPRPRGDARDPGCDPPPRGGGARCAVDGGDRAALRRVLRAGHHARAGRGADRADPQAQVPGGRRRGGVWSFIHRRRAEATVAAVEHGSRGVYNVVDDDPAPVAEWLPALAQTLGAKKPVRVPRFVGRLFAGGGRRGDDDRASRCLQRQGQARAGWHPAHPSWRQGFAAA